jgi:hypothetical protein
MIATSSIEQLPWGCTLETNPRGPLPSKEKIFIFFFYFIFIYYFLNFFGVFLDLAERSLRHAGLQLSNFRIFRK